MINNFPCPVHEIVCGFDRYCDGFGAGEVECKAFGFDSWIGGSRLPNFCAKPVPGVGPTGCGVEVENFDGEVLRKYGGTQ